MPGHSVAELRIPSAPSLWAAALEGLVSMNEQLLRLRQYPPLYDAGVRYKIEKKEAFRNVDEVYSHGWGDCDDLAGWRVAELHVTGEDPGAWADVYRTGPKRLHAIVARSDGRVEDPSLILGMPVRPERRAQMPKTIEDLGGVDDDDQDDDGGGGDGGDDGGDQQDAAPAPARRSGGRKRLLNFIPEQLDPVEHTRQRATALYRGAGKLYNLHKKLSKYSPSAFIGRKLHLWGVNDPETPESWQIGIEAPATTPKVVLSTAQVEGKHGAVVRVPAQNGKTIVLRTTPSATPSEAITKAINLARYAASTPEMVANATPEARHALVNLTKPGALEALAAVRAQEAAATTSQGFPPFPRREAFRGRRRLPPLRRHHQNW